MKTNRCKVGVDEDTKLTTVQAWGEDKEELYSEEFQEDGVEIETKAAKASRKHVASLLEGLGEEPGAKMVASAFEKGMHLETLQEFAKDDEAAAQGFSPGTFLAKKSLPPTPFSTTSAGSTSSPATASGPGAGSGGESCGGRPTPSRGRSRHIGTSSPASRTRSSASCRRSTACS